MMFSNKEIRDAFDAALDRALTMGQLTGSDFGFDAPTMDALNVVARAYPDPSNIAVQNAKIALSEYLSGKTFERMVADRERAPLGPVPEPPRKKPTRRTAR